MTQQDSNMMKWQSRMNRKLSIIESQPKHSGDVLRRCKILKGCSGHLIEVNVLKKVSDFHVQRFLPQRGVYNTFIEISTMRAVCSVIAQRCKI